MKSLPIPQEDQIRAMLDGSICEILGQYVDNPHQVDFRRFITVDRSKVLQYLVSNPHEAEQYFVRQFAVSATHDVERMFKDDCGFLVVSMFHGEQSSPRRFGNLAEAVTEHVLVSHGMY